MTKHKQIFLPLLPCEKKMTSYLAVFYPAPLAGCPSTPFYPTPTPQVDLRETDLEHRTWNFFKSDKCSHSLFVYRDISGQRGTDIEIQDSSTRGQFLLTSVKRVSQRWHLVKREMKNESLL